MIRSRVDSTGVVGVWGTYSDMNDSLVRVQVRAVAVAGPSRSMVRMWEDALRRVPQAGGERPTVSVPPSDTVWTVPMSVEARAARIATSSGDWVVAVVLAQEDVLQFTAPVTWASAEGDVQILTFARRFAEAHISARQQLRPPRSG